MEGGLPVQSSSITVNRLPSTSSRPSRIDSRTPSSFRRAVARMGAFVVWRRCRVSANPMPREAGDTKHHAILRGSGDDYLVI